MNIARLDPVTRPRGSLERCTADPENFLEKTWGRLVAFETGVSMFDDLLSLDDVDRLLTTTALRTPFFRLVKSGERIAEREYTRSGRTGSRDVEGIADPARVAALFEDGATIVLQGVHRWVEPLTRFTRELELELGHPCQVNAYVTPPGARGLDLHEDGHDVFVLQAFGHKRWQVHAAPREQDREPIEAQVGPGDTIYMPTGTSHSASAQDVVSGHVTVGVHVAPWRDVLTAAWSRMVATLDDPVPARWTADPGAFATELRQRLDAAAEGLRSIDAETETHTHVERWLSGRAQLGRRTIVQRAAPLQIDDETELRVRTGAICELRVGSDRLIVLLGDRRLEMPRWLEPAMRRIGGSEGVFVLGDLASVADPESRAVLGRRLIREGLLEIAGGTARSAGA